MENTGVHHNGGLPPDTGDFDVQRVLMDVATLRVKKHLERYELDSFNVELSSYIDYVTGNLVAEIAYRLAHEGISSFKVPKDWWQHFKLRWFPHWLIKKYPVQYQDYDVVAYYPMVSLPDKQPVVKFYKAGGVNLWQK